MTSVPSTSSPRSVPLRARTVTFDDPGTLSALLDGPSALAWIRRGDGMVASGVAHRREFDSITEADDWWRGFSATIDRSNDLAGVPGTGPLAFGSFVFDPENSAQRSVLIVPRLIIGRRDGVAWVTEIGSNLRAGPWRPAPVPAPNPPGEITYSDGSMSGPAWKAVVAEGVRRIHAGELDKVVLARDLVASTRAPLDPRWLVARLAETYERCWTYQVDGLVGASPEMLVRREAGLVTSRVLAGTIQRTDGDSDLALAAHLARSSKDLTEHEYAVASVAHALAPFCSGMNVPESPYVLDLPNVFHLATDVTAVARPGASSLGLAAALHPSAAVCGTPTEAALQLIRDIEGLDRGRYSGPVGWIDADGDGEWAIALRCGKVESDSIRLFAGCGVVAGSDPEAELSESVAKLVPMRDALEALS